MSADTDRSPSPLNWDEQSRNEILSSRTLLACPFTKRHPGEAWPPTCYGFLGTIPRLISHIHEHHAIPNQTRRNLRKVWRGSWDKSASFRWTGTYQCLFPGELEAPGPYAERYLPSEQDEIARMSRVRFERLTQQMSDLQDTSTPAEKVGIATAQNLEQTKRETGYLAKEETESPRNPITRMHISTSPHATPHQIITIDPFSLEYEMARPGAGSSSPGVHPPFALSALEEPAIIPGKVEGDAALSPPLQTPSIGGPIPHRDAEPSTPINGQSPQDQHSSKEEFSKEEVPTQFINDLDIPASVLNCYIAEFAARLIDGLRPQSLDGKTAKIVADILPDSLGHYALMMGYSPTSEAHKDVMFLVYKHRSRIVEQFSTLHERLRSKISSPDLNNLPPDERLQKWIQEIEPSEGNHAQEANEGRLTTSIFGSSEEGQKRSDALQPDVYTDVAFNGEAFQWLLSNLKRAYQKDSKAWAIEEVRERISAHLICPSAINRKDSSGPQEAEFTIKWDLKQGLMKELIDCKPAEGFSKTITITGTRRDAQVLTCRQYLTQTWPVTGYRMVKHIGAVLGTSFQKATDRLADGTQVTSFTSGIGELITIVCGTSASILDIGELLTWLGAALSTSSHADCLASSIPYINYTGLTVRSHTYRLGSTQVKMRRLSHKANGQCWHGLFRSPVVVAGFPITRKPKLESGVEIPLNIMAALAGSQQIDEFGGKNFIKSYSKMLIPARKEGDVIYWHMYESEGEDQRISFLHPTTSHAAYIENSEMEKCRHVLGWSPEAEFYAGSRHAQYDIANSYLDSPGSNSEFSGISISQGSHISEGPAFVISRKDTNLLPTIGRRTGYAHKMTWINRQSVLLWDTVDKRGWLVSGLTALLHLVRASLHSDSRGIFSSKMQFKQKLPQEPSKWTADAAASILVSNRNLGLKIYAGETGTFGDRVDTFYNILEKMIDYQKRISGDEGASFLDKPRGCLEGWDFHDIMMNSDDRMFPRATTLEQAGRSWVDLVRAMSAVTLFGRGFGQLIKPSLTDVCKRWTELPPGKFYIAVPLLHLEALINNDSSPAAHTRLGRKLIWHTETNLLEGCRCDDDTEHDAHEPVQSLIPSSMSRDIPPRQLKITVSDSAVVIFGHHSKSLLVWNDFGPPTIGVPSTDFESGQPTPFSDSGIETSSKSITAREAGTSTPSVQGQEAQPVVDIDEASSTNALRDRDSYTVGIICALHRESLVVRALLDQTFTGPDSVRGDTNVYAFGRMGRHLVVSACLPAGNYGNNPAAVCAENMRRSFENLQFCFLVGVGGGIPSPSNDVRLGDVVVSQGIKDVPAVIQYDRGKENDRGVFERTGSLSNPPTRLLGAISHLQSDPRLPLNPLETYVEEMISRMPNTDKTKYRYPGSHLDSLLEPSTGPAGPSRPRERAPRLTTDPVIHYGPIASGNKVIKSAEFRDKVAQRDGVLCFDMEAAGVAETFPALTLVVRGICDYSDAQKNKDWQDYAAANAAAYVKLLLSVVPVTARSDASSRRRADGDEEWEGQPRKRLRMGSWKP